VGAGILGAAALTALYLGIVSLAESPQHALDLFWQDRGLVIPILLGFGVQVGLVVLLKTGLYLPVGAAGGATTAAGGGMSAVAMAACCAHHVTDVLPLVGVTAAATLLANWKVPFMVAGLFTNVAGIGLMLAIILRQRRRVAAMAVAT
jgi:hypothetical protein